MTDLVLLSPLWVTALGGCLVMLVDAFSTPHAALVPAHAAPGGAASSNESSSELGMTSGLVLLLAAGLAGALWYSGYHVRVPAPWVTAYLRFDGFALFFDVLIGLSTGLATFLAAGYLREHRIERGEFYPLIIFSALGAMVLVHASDLLSVFLGLETMSLGVYCLIAYRRSNARSVEGALKYFLLGSFAAALLLFGSALLYGAAGSTQLAEIGAAIKGGTADVRLSLLGGVLVLVGAAFKVSAVPFHMWTPDAYEGAATPVTTFMAVVVKASAFAMLLRILVTGLGIDGLGDVHTGWVPFVATLTALTLIVGNFAATAQENVKRMLAYSSIAHAGYVLLGVLAAAYIGTSALESVLYYLAAYAVSSLLAFGALIGAGTFGRETVTYSDLAGFGQRHPVRGLALTLGVLSLMGFPPTAGFFGKYTVFRAALEAGDDLVWLVILAAVTSAVGAYYYLRVVWMMFMVEPEADQPTARPMRSAYVSGVVLVSALLILALGVLPEPVWQAVANAVSSLS